MSMHDTVTYGKELAPILDKLLNKYTEADKLACARRYQDEARNRRVERLGVALDRARAQAKKARHNTTEVV